MIPRFRPTTGLAEFTALIRFWERAAVERHELAFAKALGQAHAVAFPYGRTGLRLLLEALELAGSQIICPAYTCVVVPHAIVTAGAEPVFIDSTADGNMDLDAAERAITPATKALIATSIFGHPVDLDRLAALKAHHPNLLVIQDCAHSFACEWRGRSVQAAGNAAIFGCNISKIATSIFGGMVTSDDAVLVESLRHHRDRHLQPPTRMRSILRGLYFVAATTAFSPAAYWLVDRLRRTGTLSSLEEYYDPDIIDMPADHLIGMTTVEARIGAVQSARLQDLITARRQAASFYRDALEGCPGLRFLPAPDGSSFSHIAALVADPEDIREKARSAGVEIGRIIDYVCPAMACYARLSVGQEWPVATHFAAHVINLPVYGRYDEMAYAKIVRRIRPILDAAAAAPPLLSSS